MRWSTLLVAVIVLAAVAGTATAAPTIDVIERDTEAGPSGAFEFVITIENASAIDGRATASVDGSGIWTSTIETAREPRHVKVDGRHKTLAPGEHTLRVNVSLTDGPSYSEAWQVTVLNESSSTPAVATDAPAGGGGAPIAQPDSGPDLPDAVPDGVQSLVDGVFGALGSVTDALGDLVSGLAGAIGGGG